MNTESDDDKLDREEQEKFDLLNPSVCECSDEDSPLFDEYRKIIKQCEEQVELIESMPGYQESVEHYKNLLNFRSLKDVVEGR